MSKKNYYVTLGLFAALLFQHTYGMEIQEIKPKPLHEYEMNTQHGIGVAFISNDTLAVGYPGKLYFFCLHNKTFIEFEEDNSYTFRYDIVVNKDRTRLATSYHNHYLDHYDIQTKQKLPQLTCLSSGPRQFAFTCDNNLVTYFHLTKTITIKNTNTSIHMSGQCSYDQIACHPHKKSILFPGNNERTYYEACINDDDSCTFDFNSQPIIELKDENRIIGITYNHDGTLIAVNEKNRGCLLYENEKQSEYLYHNISTKPPYPYQYYAMTFNSYNILTLFSWEKILQFWDCDTKKLIHIIPILFNIPDDVRCRQNRISISPDGKLIAVAIKDKWFIFSIPPHARYSSKTITLFSFMLFALKHYKHELVIPSEILCLIMKNVMDL